MQISGSWQTCDDGIVRPLLRVKVEDATGTAVADDFLLDTGADRTVFSAAVLMRLGLTPTTPPPESVLHGIGGQAGSVLVTTALQLLRDDGSPVRIRGTFAAFTDPATTDLSILGRDVLDIFDVIVSRRRNEVLLLAERHRYRVEQG